MKDFIYTILITLVIIITINTSIYFVSAGYAFLITLYITTSFFFLILEFDNEMKSIYKFESILDNV